MKILIRTLNITITYALLILVLTLSSCSVFNSLKTKTTRESSDMRSHAETMPKEAPSESQRKERDVVSGSSKSGSSNAQSPKKQTGESDANAKSGSSSTSKNQALKSLPKMEFSPLESANIRIPNNNPFPKSGEMVFDLDKLSNDFCYPYNGKLISGYGRRGNSNHTGIDIKAIPNDTIRAAFTGTVRMSKVYSGYGNVIVIRHADGLETVYSHNSKNLVTVNDVVTSGQAIALAGRTGRATTEHLHFEFRLASETFDPTLIVDPVNQTINTGKLYCYNNSGRLLAYNTPRGQTKTDIVLDENELRKVQELKEKQNEQQAQKSQDQQIASAKSETVKPESVKTTNKSSKSTSKASTSSRSSASYHIVKSGDTLSKIARQYSTSIAKLCALNGISERKVLQLKEKIKVR